MIRISNEKLSDLGGKMSRVTKVLSFLGIGSPTFFAAVFAYLLYGGLKAPLAVVALIWLCTIVWVSSWIPFVGYSCQTYLMEHWLFPKMMELGGMQATWLTNFIYGFYATFGFLATVATSLVVLAVIALIGVFRKDIQSYW